ncbi:MAG: NmrA family NAD(P)-binding protein [Ktedonobacteraceae bacterium]|nr:NmrA family NAD(P)-binding protein [Ktedonobacteraceae bacterium]
MTSLTTILVVGATGLLGEKIARELLAKESVTTRLLVRVASTGSAEKQARIRALQAAGAQVVEGDLHDLESLKRACEGVTAIISSVQGEENIIVAGQQNLLRVAEAAGVQRFMPSDYAIDYFKHEEGDNGAFDLRRRFAAILKASRVPYTILLSGAFTEVELSPWGTLIDEQARTFSYWGDGQTTFDITASDDVAKYAVEAILDPGKANQVVQVAGDVLTMKQFLAIYQEVIGEQLVERQQGTVEELHAWIEQQKRTASSWHAYRAYQYHYGLVSGKGKLDSIENTRYPHIHPLTLRAYLERQQAQR